MDSGGQSVIADLWATNGQASESFMNDFYSNLEASGNIAESLKTAKRQYQKKHRVNGLYDWAGYQLYID